MSAFKKSVHTIDDGFCAMCGTDLTKLSNDEKNRDHAPPQGLFTGKAQSGDYVKVKVCKACHDPFSDLDQKFSINMKHAGPRARSVPGKVNALEKSIKEMLGLRVDKWGVPKCSNQPVADDILDRHYQGLHGPQDTTITKTERERFNPCIRKIVNALSIHHTGQYLLRNNVLIFVGWHSLACKSTEDEMIATATSNLPNWDYIIGQDEFTYRWLVDPNNQLHQSWAIAIHASHLLVAQTVLHTGELPVNVKNWSDGELWSTAP